MRVTRRAVLESSTRSTFFEATLFSPFTFFSSFLPSRAATGVLRQNQIELAGRRAFSRRFGSFHGNMLPGGRIQHLAHTFRQNFTGERLFQERYAVRQNPCLNNPVVWISRHVQHSRVGTN